LQLIEQRLTPTVVFLFAAAGKNQRGSSVSRSRRWRFAAELGQGVAGRALFGFFLIASPSRFKRFPADDRGNLKALGMVGTLLVD
jgi:hypothetical protein